MITLILVIIVIGILILGHEWGHFFAARILGVGVEEFGFGFPPRLISRMKNGVRYSLNALPFGGFVKIFGESGEGEGLPTSFISRPPWQRFIILGAGIFMNLCTAWILFTIAAAAGTPQIADTPASGIPVSILGVAPGSPAEAAGLKFGDQILEMRTPQISLRIEKEADVRDIADAYRGEELSLLIRRQGQIQEIRAIPRVHGPQDQGPLGIMLGRIVTVRTPWYRTPAEGLWSVGRSIGGIATGLWEVARELVIHKKAPAALSGPVGIFFFAADSRVLGIPYFLQFIGVLSVNLAVLNVLPIPALDGGRIFFLLLEKIKGRRVNPHIEHTAHALGFIVLILLMAIITYRDIVRLL